VDALRVAGDEETHRGALRRAPRGRREPGRCPAARGGRSVRPRVVPSSRPDPPRPVAVASGSVSSTPAT
jgi:hypothetical protein